MAIYSNFDGTFRDKIQIGKQGPKLATDGDTFKVTKSDDSLTVVSVAEPTADDHAVTKSYQDIKFGTAASQVRTNSESDALYQALAARNLANGYVGLDADSKIEKQFLPSLAITDTHTVHNFEERNNIATVQKGDMAIILSIPVWINNAEYPAGTLVKVADATALSGFNFYISLQTHISESDDTNNKGEPTSTTDTDFWGTSTVLAGEQTYTIGQELLHDRQIFVSLVAETHSEPTSDTTKFRADLRSDSGLFICQRDPSGAAVTTPVVGTLTVDEDWVAVDFGANVQTFNGRVGNITSQTNDYHANQITFTPHDDIISPHTQSAVVEVADKRLKKSGDVLEGALVLASASVTAPSLVISGNSKAGIFNTESNELAFAHNDSEVLRFGTEILANTSLHMGTNGISNVAEPVNNSDAATKNYVDNKPQITKTTNDANTATGVDTDVHYRIQQGGSITMPQTTSQWNSVTSDGLNYIALSNEPSNPIAATSDNSGATWTELDMPGAFGFTDRYNFCVTNGAGHYLAVRHVVNNSLPGSELIFTTDGGGNWNTVTSANFPWSGAFVAANSTLGTNYILIDQNGDSAYYSSDDGNSWIQTSLPTNAEWSSAAGRGSNFVAITTHTSGSVATARTSDGGVTWVAGGDLPQSISWKSVATSNGINFVAVGTGASNAATQVVAYSNDAGLTWSESMMPVSGKWQDLESNGSSYIAVRYGSNKAARTIDGGATWTESDLPKTGDWGRVASNGNSYVIIDTQANNATPIARSTDGGVTWDNSTTGGISQIFIKDGDTWLPYQGITSEQSNSTYVSKVGDKMTGRLVIDSGTSSYSLNTSGGITAGHSVESLVTLLNSSTYKTGGKLEIGALNKDAVNIGNAYRYSLNTVGDNSGMNFKIEALRRDGTTVERLKFTDQNAVLSSPVGIAKAAASSSLHVEVDHSGTGISVYGDAATTMQLISPKLDDSTNFISCVGDVSTIDYDASILTSEPDTFKVTSAGNVFTQSGYTAGTGSISSATKFKAYHTTGSVAFCADSLTAPVSAANIVGLDIKSRQNSELSDSHNHIRVTEGTDIVFNVSSHAINMKKRVGIGADSSNNAQLYIAGTDAVRIPVGTTAQRPTTTEDGLLRYNTDNKQTEVFEDGAWNYVNTGKWNYSKDFVNSDWVHVSAHQYKIEVPHTTHKLGEMIYAEFQEKLDSGNLRNTDFDYEVTPAGDLIVFAEVDSAVELPSGRIFVLI